MAALSTNAVSFTSRIAGSEKPAEKHSRRGTVFCGNNLKCSFISRVVLKSGLSNFTIEFSHNEKNNKKGNYGKQTVAMTLPAGNWSARAVRTFSLAELEAKKIKYSTTGTESLLMGMLTEGVGEGARFLRANGVRYFGVRYEALELLGKADMFFSSPEHPPTTEAALKALQWALDEHKKLGLDGEVTTEFILLGIWNQKGCAGQIVMSKFGIDDAKMAELYEQVAGRKKLAAA